MSSTLKLISSPLLYITFVLMVITLLICDALPHEYGNSIFLSFYLTILLFVIAGYRLQQKKEEIITFSEIMPILRNIVFILVLILVLVYIHYKIINMPHSHRYYPYYYASGFILSVFIFYRYMVFLTSME
jgi:hypothetical protein